VITDVQITKSALKDLKRIPIYLQEKFRAWVMAVSKAGLEETRKRPGWHDEPLLGNRKGQRSVRLNKQWRAIYNPRKSS
jgi:proteic killer suppression protein